MTRMTRFASSLHRKLEDWGKLDASNEAAVTVAVSVSAGRTGYCNDLCRAYSQTASKRLCG